MMLMQQAQMMGGMMGMNGMGMQQNQQQQQQQFQPPIRMGMNTQRGGSGSPMSIPTGPRASQAPTPTPKPTTGIKRERTEELPNSTANGVGSPEAKKHAGEGGVAKSPTPTAV